MKEFLKEKALENSSFPIPFDFPFCLHLLQEEPMLSFPIEVSLYFRYSPPLVSKRDLRDGTILLARYQCTGTGFVHSGHRKRCPVESLGKIWIYTF